MSSEAPRVVDISLAQFRIRPGEEVLPEVHPVLGYRCPSQPADCRARCGDCPASYDEELFERLRVWRKARADEDEVPAFVVFTDATLQLIAEQRPTSAAALLRISGVGPAKLERYGDSLLEVVG